MADTQTSAPPRERVARASLRPALVVLAVVAVIIVGGGLLAIFSGSTAKSNDRSTVPSRLIVEGVQFSLARTTLLNTEHGPLIPGDVISSLAIPLGAKLTRVVNLDNGNGPFDRQVDLVSTVSRSQLLTAYTTLLNEYGWRQSGTETMAGRSGSSAIELLAQRASSDGYNWEVGVTLTVGTPITAVTASANRQPRASLIAMRLLQVPEGN